MEWPALMRERLKVLFRRAQFDRELQEEMQFHMELEAEAEELEGMPAEEARVAARRRFGNTTLLREAGWYAWGWGPVERLLQNLRFAVRTLRRSPGFALSVVLLLAFAIWMNTTVFSVIHAVMLAPLPFERPEDLVRLYETNARDDQRLVAPANFAEWRDGSHTLEDMAGVAAYRCELEGEDAPEEVPAMLVTEGFFRALRVHPALGRGFLPEEYPRAVASQPVLNGISTAIISDALWHRRFGANPDVVGATLRISDPVASTVVRVVGVMPADFASTSATLGPSDIWLPYAPDASAVGGNLSVIARRRPGVSLRQAQAEMEVFAGRLKSDGRSNASAGARVADLREAAPGGYRTSLLVLAGAVALVLLIACANVANLMLARSAARVREMATRAAIGASRASLVAQMATESVFLSLTAGALGFALSLASVRAIVALAPSDVPRIAGTTVNMAVLCFCLLIAVATGLLCGMAPAWRVSRFNLSAALKEGGAASASAARGLLTRSLVVLEVAMSLVLLVGAALLARSFRITQTLRLGIQADHVLTVSLMHGRKPEPADLAAAFYRELLLRFQRIPGVVSAAAGAIPPRSTLNSIYFKEGSPERINCSLDMPSADYFRTLRIPLLAGRIFTESESAAVVNRTAARLTWPGEQALGKRIRMSPKGGWMTVVGIVEDVPNQGLQLKPGPGVYLPLGVVVNMPARYLVIRTTGDAGAISQAVRAAIRSFDNRVTIRRIATLEENLASATAGLRFNTLLMTVFAGLAFLLAASGVYSLMSYTVTLRTREMSIRMAMGADRDDIVSLIVRTGARLVGIGVAVGLGGALLGGRFLSSLLYQVKPRDPLSFLAAAALLTLAALAACYFPARRAAGLEVVETLRHE